YKRKPDGSAPGASASARTSHDLAAKASKPKRGEDYWIEICNVPVPVKKTRDGVRAVKGAEIIEPASAETYLVSKFGEDLDTVPRARPAPAASLEPAELADAAYALYMQFRPSIPDGTRGWGAKGVLDLERIRLRPPRLRP